MKIPGFDIFCSTSARKTSHQVEQKFVQKFTFSQVLLNFLKNLDMTDFLGAFPYKHKKYMVPCKM